MTNRIEWRFPNGGAVQFTAVTDLTGHAYVGAVKQSWLTGKFHELAREFEAEAKRTIANGHIVE